MILGEELMGPEDTGVTRHLTDNGQIVQRRIQELWKEGGGRMASGDRQPIWGGAPSRIQERSTRSEGQVANLPEAESLLALQHPKEGENLALHE